MINPFSGFLQPPTQSSPLAGAAQHMLALSERQRQHGQDQQRALENSQQHALAQRGATRADAQLALQQGEQAHRFTAEEQKQVEGLLAEYQDAEDQGDQVRLSRASQMLKRFGMDVSQAQKPAPLPGQLLPDVQAFTGEKPPIDGVVKEEMASREALRAKNAAPEQDLSQEDFESQLVNGSAPGPSRYEEGGKTTDEFKAMLPQSAEEPTDLGEVDSPAFKAAAETEGGVIDLDKESPTPLQIGQLPKVQAAQGQEAPQGPPPRLPGQLLPTVVSKGGKQLYESTGPSGRWAPMVSGVFDQFVQHENPEMAAAGKRAQSLATKLISVDGYSPKDAIKEAGTYLNGEANRITGLERTKIGSRRAGGTGGGSTVVGDAALTGKELAVLGDDAQQLMLSITAKPEYQKVKVMDDVLDGAESALQSDDPVRQQQAISDIMRARSGLTVRKDEEASLRNSAGLWEGLMSKLTQQAGYGLTQDYRQSLAQAIAAQRAINQQVRSRIASETKQFYITTRTTSDTDTGSRATQVRRNAGGIDKMLSRSAGSDPNADLDR
jgi:hypothetical protein